MNNPVSVLDAMIADPAINGQHVDVDGQYGGQCWDLVELFAERCGVPKAPWSITLNAPNGLEQGVAKNAWLYFDNNPNLQTYFDKISAGQQQKGDITVYDAHGIYTEGHIALSLGGSAVFEENADPDGSPAHVFNNRSSTFLLGALRLKGSYMSTIATKDIVDSLAHAYLNDSVDHNPGLQGYIGQPVENVISAFNNSAQRDAWLKYINGLEQAQNPIPLNPGVYKVS